MNIEHSFVKTTKLSFVYYILIKIEITKVRI